MRPRNRLLLIVLGLLLPVPAFAHHAMGGAAPLTFVQGFISGLAHPVIGLDHLLFLLMAGVLAFSLKPPLRYAAPVLFVVSALAGTTIHLAGFALSSVEVVIASSVAVGGAMVFSRRRMNVVALSAFLAVAGMFHGYAYAESIMGAQTGPLMAYLAGLACIQATLITGVSIGLTKLNARAMQSHAVRAERFAGGAALLAGAVWLASSFV